MESTTLTFSLSLPSLLTRIYGKYRRYPQWIVYQAQR